MFAAALEIARLYATGAAYRTGLYERLLRRSGVTRRDYANLMNYLKASGRRPFPRREFQDRFAAADRVWQRLAIPDGASEASIPSRRTGSSSMFRTAPGCASTAPGRPRSPMR